jgi:pyruvate,water dikinase
MRINIKGDLIIARTNNVTRLEMEQILDGLGRLIAFTRQLDVLMDDDKSVQDYAVRFLKGTF